VTPFDQRRSRVYHSECALAHEDISSGFLFSLETTQGAKLGTAQWMDLLKRKNSPYRFGRCREWVKKNPDASAATREAEEDWS
jgi:hypothetical protein